jgi:hypothetical protein
MATNKKTIEFTAKNVKAFTGWLKRFSLIDNSLLLEIDQVKSLFIAKTYNEEHSVVKMSSIKFDEAGLTAKVNSDTKRIKVGIFNIPRLIKVIDQFSDVEFTFTIEYQELIGDNDTQYAAEKILLKNKFLKMNVDCTSLNIFKYMTDSFFTDNIATIDKIAKFELQKSTLEKINTLNSLDSEHKFMNFKIDGKKTFVSGKSFELLIFESSEKAEVSLPIFKDQYAALDTENYDVQLGEDRLVFTSKDSETVTAISKAEDSE